MQNIVFFMTWLILSLYKVTEWLSFKKELFTPYIFIVICLFVILDIVHFGYEGKILVLIAQASGRCLPFTSNTMLQ